MEANLAFDETTAIAMRNVARLEAENAKLRAVCADILSVRDQFAKAAMQGLMANPGGPVQASGMSGWAFTNCDKNDVAELAYIMADAMLAQRNAGATPPTAPLPKWEPCNEGCDPEFNGCRSRSCKCPAALAALGVMASDGGQKP